MKKLTLHNKAFKLLVHDYKQWLDILGYAESTVYYLPIHLQEFFYYLETQKIYAIHKVGVTTIKQYYIHLQERSNERRSGGLSKGYLNKHRQALKKFSEYLSNHGYKGFNVHLKTETNPTEEKTDVLTQDEIKALFLATTQAHKKPQYQKRDKAMLVVLYSCGLRRTEAVSLDISDILFDKERIHVRKGKNYKERFIPINRANAEILEDYLYEARSQFLPKEDEPFFINSKGERMQGATFANRLKKIVQACNDNTITGKSITPHSLRHSIATHLLQQGVKLEQIKIFLGHSSLESTQIYAHLLKNLADE